MKVKEKTYTIELNYYEGEYIQKLLAKKLKELKKLNPTDTTEEEIIKVRLMRNVLSDITQINYMGEDY